MDNIVEQNNIHRQILKENVSDEFEYDDCRFCEIYNTNAEKPISDIILYESKSFFIIPALGCLVRNYVMIISKKHINSMCYLEAEEKKELVGLLNKIRVVYKNKYGYCPIVFEHGASNTDSNKSACCVSHAHLHIVPYIMTNQDEMIKTLNLMCLNDLYDYFSVGYDIPYIFYMDNQGGMYFKSCEKDVLPSQIIRKWIAVDLGVPNCWDWRITPLMENVQLTVDELKPLFRKTLDARDYSLKYIYYCRAMDGLDVGEIKREYEYIQTKLEEQGRTLVNPYANTVHRNLKLNKLNAELIVTENLNGISKADCVVVNLSIKNHIYIGCIAEMVYAKQKGCYVVVISGESGAEKHFHTIYHADKIFETVEDWLKTNDWR